MYKSSYSNIQSVVKWGGVEMSDEFGDGQGIDPAMRTGHSCRMYTSMIFMDIAGLTPFMP